VLIAYMDESGHAADPRSKFVGMGGLVAQDSAWNQFETEWHDALAEAGIEGGFHMVDFAGRQGPYKGWEEERRRKLFGTLVGAIVKTKAEPVGCVVSLDDFNAAPPKLQEFFKDPYHMAFQAVTRGAALQALPKDYPFTPETVAMVYAYQSEYGATEVKDAADERQAGSAQKLWHAMKKLTIVGQWMGSYSSALARDSFPLQAADLFAYELTKEFENLIKRPQDNMRWALRQILSYSLAEGPPLIQFYDSHEMVRVFLEATGQDNAPGRSEFMTSSFLRKTAVREFLHQRIRNNVRK
jgi:hypothetical protein